MRIYFRKFVQVCFVICVFSLLILNFYKRDEWLLNNNHTPWGVNYGKKIEKNYDNMASVLHQRVRTSQKPSILRNSSTNIFFKPLRDSSVIYPQADYNGDRIVNQLEFVPKTLVKNMEDTVPLKKILLYNGFGSWAVKPGQQTFVEQKCLVNRCTLSADRQTGEDADAILFSHSPSRPKFTRPPHQIWILFMLESPYHTPGLSAYKNIFNWTASYRHDSTIVAPYERFQPYNESILTKPLAKNYAEGKTKKIAWFVSNCGARNGRRKYADELSKYIPVDIYGGCGTLKCPRHHSKRCFDMLNKDYKFYLAFENSNCRDYITEKFFVNGLQHDIVPIVMGGSPEDYKRAAPVHSYIHVDDFDSPKQLAEYLLQLDTDDNLYNEYFRWKGTGTFINTYFWCRVCALLNDENRTASYYEDVEKWWRGPGVCIGQETWRNYQKKIDTQSS